TVADPVMRQLRDQLSLTINLAGIGRNSSVIVLKSLVGTLVFEIGVRVGTELPMSATSQGKVIMAFSKRPYLSAYKRQKLQAFTKFTTTDYETLEKEVIGARERGWAMAAQETTLGINAVSVPIF